MAEIKQLPGDLPEDWQLNQAVTPNGTEAGLDEKHGYNYLMKQVNEAHTAVNILDQNKVDKVAGKALSTNDYTTVEKQKLAGLSNYDDTAVKHDITEANSAIGSLQRDVLVVNGEVNKLKLLPKFENIVLSSASWSSATPSTYTLLDSRYLALTSYWEFSIPDNAVEAQMDAFENAEIDIDGSVDGVIKFVAVGTKPNIDLPVLVKIEK